MTAPPLPPLTLYPLTDRSRVEHANRRCVYSHELFTGRKYLGSFQSLKAFITITVHMTAKYIREYAPQGTTTAQGFGNWPHFVA